MIAPARTQVTLKYGVYDVAGYTRESPHAGVDYSHSPDKHVYAPENGIITAKAIMGDCGDALELTGQYKHRFCHMSERWVNQGEAVKKGQRIGVMGNTGRAFGVHLHWILWVDGVRVNGEKYINERHGMTEEQYKAIMASQNDLKNWLMDVQRKVTYLQAQVNDLKDWELDTNRKVTDENTETENPEAPN